MNGGKIFKKGIKAALVIAVLGFLLYFAFYLPFLITEREPKEFQGTIQEKWVSETYYGIQNSRNIIVKSDDGQQFKISLDSDIYNQVETGMRVKRNSAGSIEIVENVETR